MDVKTFRDDLFQMNTRCFGSVMELAIRNFISMNNSVDNKLY
ncbi:hypothetical protein [Bacillus tropicus]|nr:hypothetical protein [Bacillus tropicus]